MKLFKIYFTAAVVLALPTFASARTLYPLEYLSTIRAIKAECLSLGDTQPLGDTQLSCVSSAFDSSNKLLNRQYQEIINSFNPSLDHQAAKSRLKLEERAWILSRDATCAQYQNSLVDYKSCLYNETSKRIEELDKQFPDGFYVSDEERAIMGSHGQDQIDNPDDVEAAK